MTWVKAATNKDTNNDRLDTKNTNKVIIPNETPMIEIIINTTNNKYTTVLSIITITGFQLVDY